MADLGDVTVQVRPDPQRLIELLDLLADQCRETSAKVQGLVEEWRRQDATEEERVVGDGAAG